MMNQNRKKRRKHFKSRGVTLKELIEKAVVDEYYHLKEQRFVGGLSMPEKMNNWWKELPK